jgi:hypothetical protein
LDKEDVVRKKLKLSWLKERNQRDEELKKDNYGRIDERDEEHDQEREKNQERGTDMIEKERRGKDKGKEMIQIHFINLSFILIFFLLFF